MIPEMLGTAPNKEISNYCRCVAETITRRSWGNLRFYEELFKRT